MKVVFGQYEIVITLDDLSKDITVEDVIAYVKVKVQDKEEEIHVA